MLTTSAAVSSSFSDGDINGVETCSGPDMLLWPTCWGGIDTGRRARRPLGPVGAAVECYPFSSNHVPWMEAFVPSVADIFSAVVLWVKRSDSMVTFLLVVAASPVSA